MPVNQKGASHMGSPLHDQVLSIVSGLFRLNGILFVLPFVPTAFKSINLVKAFIHHHQRHTGAGSFVPSSAIENESLLLVVVVSPLVNSPWVDPVGTGNFHCRP